MLSQLGHTGQGHALFFKSLPLLSTVFARHSANHIAYIISLIPQSNLMRSILIPTLQMMRLSPRSLKFLANKSFVLEPWCECKSVWLQYLCFWKLYSALTGSFGFQDVMFYLLGSGLSLSICFIELLGTLTMIATFALNWPYLNLYIKLEEISCFLTIGPSSLLYIFKI